MHLTETQAENVYKSVLTKLKAHIIKEHGTLAKFGEAKGFNRTSLIKQFSDNIQQEISLGMFLRLSIACGKLQDETVSDFEKECTVPLRTFLRLTNSSALALSVTLVANDL